MSVSRLTRRTLAAGVAITASALTVTVGVSAPAQAAWTTPWNVSAPGWLATDSPKVAVDRQGDAILVWEACDGAQPYCYHQIQARIKPASGSMTSIQNLSPLGADVAWPEVATDDDGDSAVVWEQEGHVVGRRVSSNGTLGALRTLSTTGATGMNPTVVVDPSGRALAAWTEYRGGGYYTVARYLDLDSSVGPVRDLGSGSADQPSAAVDRNGQAVVAWAENYERVVARRIRYGAPLALRAFTSPSSGAGFGRVTVAVDRDGDAIVSFRRWRTGEQTRVWVRQWNKTDALGTVTAVSPATDIAAQHHALATDFEGDSMLVWTRQNTTTKTEVFGRSISRTGALGAVTSLGVGDRPDLTLDDDGDGMVAWHTPGPPSTPTQVMSRTVTRTGSFGTAKAVTTDGSVPQVDASPTGRSTIIWQQRSHPYTIHAITGP